MTYKVFIQQIRAVQSATSSQDDKKNGDAKITDES